MNDNQRCEASQVTTRCDVQQVVFVPYHGMALSGTELALLSVHLSLLLHAYINLTSYSEILISEKD